MKNLCLLLIEDEVSLGKTLGEYLKSKQFNLEWAQSCKEAEEKFATMNPPADVVLMDIGLPDGSGLDLARKFRTQRKDVVLLFLSALNDPATRLEGLEIGAEDYITKPFELRELILRLERILSGRNLAAKNPEEWRFGKLKFWPRRFEVQDATGLVISLGQKETAILLSLLEKKGEVISRDELIEQIWGEESFPTNRTVDNYIVKLRKWAESDETDMIKITSVRGVGYKVEIKG